MDRRRAIRVALATLAVAPLAACGDTWDGLKRDTRDNTRRVGEKVERAGEKMQKR